MIMAIWHDPFYRFLLYPLCGLLTLIVVWLVDRFPSNSQDHQGHITSSPVLLMIWAWPLFWLVGLCTTVRGWMKRSRN
ncbi:hypothetical protein PQR75_06500 [Paraburkholderia fungorum]|uniref:hypothetical protein n=1 Tax=Paraburkholderia fungorum TaxID=134537 RepID=UPI0038BB6770